METWLLKLTKFLLRLFHILIKILPAYLVILIMSKLRNYFIDYLIHNNSLTTNISDELSKLPARVLWGIKFNNPLMNAAGLFKNGDGYSFIASQGFGGYIGGTSTYNRRIGNKIKGISLPFLVLPISNIAINSLGLPNNGDNNIDDLKITDNKVDGCPIGWSVMRSPDYAVSEGLDKLIVSLNKVMANNIIDFIEVNESCPNVAHINSSEFDLNYRLKFIADNFLAKRQRQLPVIIKISNDIDSSSLYNLIDLLVKYQYDGLNIGNTSTNYQRVSKQISSQEVKLFNYFTKYFKGGVSGSVLKTNSLNLSILANNYVKSLNLDYEFNIIRTGGIDSIDDIIQSEINGIKLNQWYTGYIKSILD
jgi:dihydroorotate dehydrogenase